MDNNAAIIIMDNLFLIQDILDICKSFELKVGLFSLDQKKAFDRVDHGYLFNVLKAFGIGDSFLNMVKLLYSGAACICKSGRRAKPANPSFKGYQTRLSFIRATL